VDALGSSIVIAPFFNYIYPVFLSGISPGDAQCSPPNRRKFEE